MRDITYPPIIAGGYGFFRLLNLKFDVVGGENLPRTGGAVLASNHVSYLDFIFCGFAARPSKRLVRFMAKKSTFDHRVSGPLMRSMHHIPVDRAAGAHAFDAAVESLRSGEVVGVFPEATISQSFELKDFKTGAVRMAAEAQVPVVPMITFGGQRLWTKGHKRDMERGTTIALTVGEPLHFTVTDDPTAATRTLKAAMQRLYDATVERYPDQPPSGTWWWPARFGGGAPTLEQMRAQEEAERIERESGRTDR
ncbi:MAG: lysophospholipid acyltransferase family protein [Candidatus Nanopelagicales bacterium]